MSESPAATVVVCTRNRSLRLAEVLEAALAVESPPGGWELVVVDNRSTDDTPEVARGVAADHPGRVRIVVEPELGLSAARNAGIRAARGEVLVFLDDDAFPVPGWLTALVAACDGEEVLAAGGPVEPLFQGELPEWFLGRYLPYLSAWERGGEPHRLTYNEYPRGANIAFHRRAFERFGPFSTDLGRKGRSLLSGEETEVCLRIERGGGAIAYVPGARVRHLTDAGRITPGWLERRFFAQGRTEAVIDWRHGGMPALATDLRQHAANAIAAWRNRGMDGALFARCQRRALAGFLRGCTTAPLRVRRWRPKDDAPRGWSPIRSLF